MKILSVACICVLASLLATAVAMPSLAQVGIDARTADKLTARMPLLGEVAAPEQPSLLEVEASSQVEKKPVISDMKIFKLMQSVLPEMDAAQEEDVESLFNLDDTVPSEALDESTVFLESDVSIAPSALVETEEQVETEEENAPLGAAPAGADLAPAQPGASYEAGNWGGPQIGPGGAAGAYWVGGGYAANNHPGPYIPGVPIFQPGSNLNPFYYPERTLRFNPYIPYSFGVWSPPYGPHYNGQPYLNTGRFAPGPADAGTQVTTTTTFNNAFVETETETETDAEAEESQEESTPGDNTSTFAAKEVVPPADVPFPIANEPFPDPSVKYFQAELEAKPKDQFYNEYSTESGYNPDVPEHINKIRQLMLDPPKEFYNHPEYKELPSYFDSIKPMTGRARDAAFKPLNRGPVAQPEGTVGYDIIPSKMIPKPKTTSLLESVNRAQNVVAEEIRAKIASGELSGISARIAETGHFEPTFSE